MKNLFLLLVTMFVWLAPPNSFAVDVPFGSDAIEGLLLNSQTVVWAKFDAEAGKRFYKFTPQKTLFTPAPLDPNLFVLIPANTSRQFFRVGETVMLFLRDEMGRRPDGTVGRLFVPAMTGYSFVRTPPEDLGGLESAVKVYLAYRSQPEVFRPQLLKLLNSKNAYIQYSAATDLFNDRLLRKEDSGFIARLLERGTVRDPQARKMLIHALGSLQVRAHAGLLEKIVSDPKEKVGARIAAVEALSDMGAVDSLKRIAPAVDQSPSLGLKNKFVERLPR